MRTRTQNRAYVSKKLAHLDQREGIQPPPDRDPDELDAVIEGIIDALPAASRLYPDLYAWIVADAVREQLSIH